MGVVIGADGTVIGADGMVTGADGTVTGADETGAGGGPRQATGIVGTLTGVVPRKATGGVTGGAAGGVTGGASGGATGDCGATGKHSQTPAVKSKYLGGNGLYGVLCCDVPFSLFAVFASTSEELRSEGGCFKQSLLRPKKLC